MVQQHACRSQYQQTHELKHATVLNSLCTNLQYGHYFFCSLLTQICHHLIFLSDFAFVSRTTQSKSTVSDKTGHSIADQNLFLSRNLVNLPTSRSTMVTCCVQQEEITPSLVISVSMPQCKDTVKEIIAKMISWWNHVSSIFVSLV